MGSRLAVTGTSRRARSPHQASRGRMSRSIVLPLCRRALVRSCMARRLIQNSACRQRSAPAAMRARLNARPDDSADPRRGGADRGQFHAQNGPRCIQAAAGSCFAFAKRSVLIQTTLRCRERLNFTRTVACRTWIFRENVLPPYHEGRSGVATSKKKRSVYLTRRSHSSSLRVADFVFKVVTSGSPESNLAACKQFSVLACRPSVKSRFMRQKAA